MIRHFTEDGRRFLQRSDADYDVIFSDVYSSLFSIPAHVTTQEFFQLAKERLSEDGVFIGNFIGDLSRESPSLLFSEIKTFQSVFPNSYVFAVNSPAEVGAQNFIFLGMKSNARIALDTASMLDHEDPFMRALSKQVLDLKRFDIANAVTLTDKYAPVDYLTAQQLKRSFNATSRLSGGEMLATIAQQLEYGPRFIGSDGYKMTQGFLGGEMRALTNDVILQSWPYLASDGEMYHLTNIVGRLYPERTKRVILGTHYDSKRFADRDAKYPAKPVPGANDSASGVSVLVEAARVLRYELAHSDTGVDFVFFDGEEGDPQQGADYQKWTPLGSTYFAEYLAEIYPRQRPDSAVIIDMVCEKGLRILKEPSSVKYAPKQSEALWKVGKALKPQIFLERFSEEIRDDHTPLNTVGIPSVLLIDFEYPAFHTTADTLSECSGTSLEAVLHVLTEYVRAL